MLGDNPLAAKLYLKDLEREVAALRAPRLRPYRPARTDRMASGAGSLLASFGRHSAGAFASAMRRAVAVIF